MKAKETYLKGKSVFIISLIVVGLTALTVYLSGLSAYRPLIANFYISLGIIAFCLFLFLFYGLYYGVELIDNFPPFPKFRLDNTNLPPEGVSEISGVEVGDGIEGIILSVIWWILMSILLFVMLILFEAVFWFSLMAILTLLYWVFFRALKLVFSLSTQTKGNWSLSIAYSLVYTILYTGWIFGIVYLVSIKQ